MCVRAYVLSRASAGRYIHLALALACSNDASEAETGHAHTRTHTSARAHTNPHTHARACTHTLDTGAHARTHTPTCDGIQLVHSAPYPCHVYPWDVSIGHGRRGVLIGCTHWLWAAVGRSGDSARRTRPSGYE
jgi:hypothetical protein